MCFAPYVSLATFVIEFLLALYFLLKNPKDKLNRFIALLSFLLGTYQLNEFLICVTEVSIFTRLAMITTAILPALGVSYALIMRRNKIRYYWKILIYSPAVFFMLMFFFGKLYETSAKCMTVFIEYPDMGLLGKFYSLYYFAYIVAAGILFYFGSVKASSKYERRLMHLGIFGMLIFTLPTFAFLLFLPGLYIQFPSVLCEFALLLAIEFIIVLWYKDKHNIKY